MEILQTFCHLRSTDVPHRFAVQPLATNLPSRRRAERCRGYRDKTQWGSGAGFGGLQRCMVPRQKAVKASARSEPFRNTTHPPRGGLLRPQLGDVLESAPARTVCNSHAAAVSESLGENGKAQNGQVASDRRQQRRSKLGRQWEEWWRVPYVHKKEKEKEDSKTEAVPRSTLELAGQLWKVMDPPTYLLLGAMVFMVGPFGLLRIHWTRGCNLRRQPV
jgi:hypothetical protein